MATNRARKHRIRIGTSRPEAVKLTPSHYKAGTPVHAHAVARPRAGSARGGK